MTHPSAVVPVGWAATSASAVCEKIQDGTHFSPKVQLTHGTYRYVTAKNVRPTGLDLTDIAYLREDDHQAIYARCDTRRNDVLLVKDGVNAGDAAINTLDDEISLLSSVCFLRPNSALLSPAFLRYYLLCPEASAHLTGSLTGTAIRRIVLHKVKELPVLIAPLPEQHRIVEAIESHLWSGCSAT
jgi:type I restriction enzyme S subunit